MTIGTEGRKVREDHCEIADIERFDPEEVSIWVLCDPRERRGFTSQIGRHNRLCHGF